MSRPVIAVAGNPNCGKTTLFNALTGANAKVGNYPGITVERREGTLHLPDGSDAVLLDIPGTYSLSARTAEEQVAITAMAGLQTQREPDAVIVVVDSTQLARNLYLTLQVLDLRLRVVVALSMSDIVRKHRVTVEAQALARHLGVPVVPIAAQRGEGIDELLAALVGVLDRDDSISRSIVPPLTGVAGEALDAVAPAIPDAWCRDDEQRRRALAGWALLSIEDGDELWDVPEALRREVTSSRARAAAAGVDLDLELVAGHYAVIDRLIDDVLVDGPGLLRRASDAVDKVLIHPLSGFALFLLVMVTMFQSLFSWSAPAIDFVDGLFASTGEYVASALPPGLLTDLLVDGLIAGVGAVLVFLPQIILLFLFIALMEDTGYMARVAFLMDRLMKSLGLTGRAFVPMLSGFACAIPAVMATRTMERRRDRMLTMMTVPIMTCSARLPVYTLIIAALYPTAGEPGGEVLGLFSLQALLMVAMYLFSTVLALAAAGVLGRTLFKGTTAPLVLELPPYRLPTPRSVVRLVWERARLFVTEAGTVILTCTVALWVLLTFPQDVDLSRDYAAEAQAVEARAAWEGLPDSWVDEQFDELQVAEQSERLQKSWGGRLGHALEPVIAPLGFDWKIGVGLIGAFAAREVFVSTMGVVYGIGDDADEESAPLREHIQAETWPDGRKVYTPLVGISLMVFFALAAQCMSTLAVVKRETRSYRWPVFLFSYMTAMAYVASLLVYQGGMLLGLG